jgi:hypothetical protein
VADWRSWPIGGDGHAARARQKKSAGQVALAGARKEIASVPIEPENARFVEAPVDLAMPLMQGETGRAVQLDGVRSGDAKNAFLLSRILGQGAYDKLVKVAPCGALGNRAQFVHLPSRSAEPEDVSFAACGFRALGSRLPWRGDATSGFHRAALPTAAPVHGQSSFFSRRWGKPSLRAMARRKNSAGER